jgi:hypothetical protein
MTGDIFKADAKAIVDMVFDTNLFKEGITRDQMNGIEELISYSMQSRFDTNWKAKELFERIKSKKP